jgi:hypothetical protein
MKLIILFLFSFCLFFSGCTKKSDEKSVKAPSDEVKVSNEPLQKTKEITLLSFKKTDLPSECKYEGDIVEQAQWTDANGDNILIITETPVKKLKEDIREQYIYAYTYTKKDADYKLLWSINDHVDSPCDVGAEYQPKTLEVLDIDKDGVAETAFIYKLEGRCDVSPLDMKLMMHSGDKKLVIRGNTKVYPGGGESYGGKKSIDAAFDSSPVIFKDFASRKWDDFMKDYKGP